jgi:DNA-directed RNA polymerase subunit RPC12/RpoP
LQVQHSDQTQRQKDYPETPATAMKNYICDFCGKDFQSKDQLTEHHEFEFKGKGQIRILPGEVIVVCSSIKSYIIINFFITMVVVVKCKKCGQEFPSTLVNVSDEKMFKSDTLTNNNTETCPSCSQTSDYGGSEYFWKL